MDSSAPGGWTRRRRLKGHAAAADSFRCRRTRLRCGSIAGIFVIRPLTVCVVLVVCGACFMAAAVVKQVSLFWLLLFGLFIVAGFCSGWSTNLAIRHRVHNHRHRKSITVASVVSFGHKTSAHLDFHTPEKKKSPTERKFEQFWKTQEIMTSMLRGWSVPGRLNVHSKSSSSGHEEHGRPVRLLGLMGGSCHGQNCRYRQAKWVVLSSTEFLSIASIASNDVSAAVKFSCEFQSPHSEPVFEYFQIWRHSIWNCSQLIV